VAILHSKVAIPPREDKVVILRNKEAIPPREDKLILLSKEVILLKQEVTLAPPVDIPSRELTHRRAAWE